MSLRITDICISCDLCEPECPNNAIYPGGVEWAMTDGTSVSGLYTLMNGSTTEAGERHAPLASNAYYIVADKCTECQGFHEEPQCAAVCPVDCCVPDDQYREAADELLAKRDRLHL